MFSVPVPGCDSTQVEKYYPHKTTVFNIVSSVFILYSRYTEEIFSLICIPTTSFLFAKSVIKLSSSVRQSVMCLWFMIGPQVTCNVACIMHCSYNPKAAVDNKIKNDCLHFSHTCVSTDVNSSGRLCYKILEKKKLKALERTC